LSGKSEGVKESLSISDSKSLTKFLLVRGSCLSDCLGH
jgi:hypothetical protein